MVKKVDYDDLDAIKDVASRNIIVIYLNELENPMERVPSERGKLNSKFAGANKFHANKIRLNNGSRVLFLRYNDLRAFRGIKAKKIIWLERAKMLLAINPFVENAIRAIIDDDTEIIEWEW